MAYNAAQGDWVPAETHKYVLTNFRIAHEKVEQQRQQLQEQEKQVAELRARIASLEGRGEPQPRINGQQPKAGGTSVDDWSIKNSASKLEKLINRWAADVIRAPPIPLTDLCDSILTDLGSKPTDTPDIPASPMLVQSLLRHVMAETVSDGVVNCLIVTSSSEANVQLTRIHEHLFARDPTVAAVWRRQTFSAAVEACSPEMGAQLLADTSPSLARLFAGPPGTNSLDAAVAGLLDAAYGFSRMLHGAGASAAGGADTFYRAFVPDLGSTLYPRQIELIKRCLKSEAGIADTVGATVFPGLVKVSKGQPGPDGNADVIQTVVRRAQVICSCALAPRPSTSSKPASEVGSTTSY